MKVKNGNSYGWKKEHPSQGDATCTLREITVSQELRLLRKCFVLKLFLDLGCCLLNLADPEVLISAGSSDDLAIFLNIFFKINKLDKHNMSNKLPWLPGIRRWFKECKPGAPWKKSISYSRAVPSPPHFFSQFLYPLHFCYQAVGMSPCSKTHSNWQLWIKEHWKH